MSETSNRPCSTSQLDLAAPEPVGMGDSFVERLARYRQRALDHLLQSLPAREPQRHLYAIIRSFLARAGKGLRPALCLAACGAEGGELDNALQSAAALELLHNAFLVHDDIEDESELRHQHPTMHVEHGVPLAVNAGDAMNALSMQMFRDNHARVGPLTASRILAEVDHMLMRSLEGQAMELGWIRDNCGEVRTADYLRMVLHKTCWYSFIHPLRIGALAADGLRRDLDRYNRLGYFLGAAFQIQDDVLNLTGSHAYGKELQGDLWEGKRTLMLTHLMSRDCESAFLTDFLRKPRGKRLPREVHRVRELLDRHGSIDFARKVASQLAQAARCELTRVYGDAGPGEHVEFIRQCVEYMTSRDV